MTTKKESISVETESVISDKAEKMVEPTALNRDLTFGEKLVGIKFNPSADNKVDKVKVLCAELADMILEEKAGRDKNTLDATLFDHTVGQILNAQMNVVKYLTLKY